ncbi:MAG: TolC family protein [Vicinamibacteria bacterium]|nr:TolC family protein [Vicinamibacteria bacterium]
MSVPSSGLRAGGALVLILSLGQPAAAQTPPLNAEGYVQIVLRAHPSAAQSAGLVLAAEAEKKAVRRFSDPVFEYSRGRATARGASGAEFTETSYSVSQTLPWPGTFNAGSRAGDRAADGLRAGAEALRWELAAQARQAFARLVAGRALLDIARAAEGDARSLRDLVAQRADLGESREADRIKATVEWLRQQRQLVAAEREAEAAVAILRALAVEPLPDPLSIEPRIHGPLPALDRAALAATIVEHSPRLRAAQAEAERRQALLDTARSARIPDLALRVFKDKELDKEAKGIALGVTVPLWNRNVGEVARADAARQVSAAEAARTRIDLLGELQGRLKELQVAADQAALLDAQILPAARRSVGLVRFSFEEGEGSLLDLLDAQRTFRDTQREAADAHLALSLALAELQRMAGPDFDPWSSR